MNIDSFTFQDEHRRDLDEGNVLTHDPNFDPAANGLGGGEDDLELPVAVEKLDKLRQRRQEWIAFEAENGVLTPDELEEVVSLEAEIIVEERAKQMIKLAEEHPKYTWHVGELLTERLDELKAEGHPVDAVMYLEAEELAEEIVSANPDKNADELTEIVVAMVKLNQAQARVKHLALAA